MADEPNNLVLVHLREIRGELKGVCDELSQIRLKLSEHDARFDKMDKRLDEVHEAAILGVGFASLANHKLEQLRESVDDHGQRISALEADTAG